MTGCARSEGYYKIDMRDKVKYLPHHKLKTTTVTEQKKVSCGNLGNTVEPLNKDTSSGTSRFVLCREVVLFRV